MSSKVRYTDWVVNPITNKIFSGKIKSTEEGYLRIPYEFSAFIKDDTAYHGLEGRYVGLRFDENEDDLWFIAIEPELPFSVPSCDIDFETIRHNKEDEDGQVIPPIPTIEQLQNCLIDFEDNKTTVTYITDNGSMYYGTAKCHEDDEFDILTGIAIAYDRAVKKKEEFEKVIRVGDIVKVVKPGANYARYETKLKEIFEKVNDPVWLIRFAYGDFLFGSPDQHDTYKVLYVDDSFAFIENLSNESCRLIGIEGIAKKEG